MKLQIIENDEHKIVKSESYNYFFSKTDGFFIRFGKNKDEDPEYSPFGPEILDIEVSTICNGIASPNTIKEDYVFEDGKKVKKITVIKGVESPCKFCYKSNTKNGKNMSLESFKKIIDKMPRTLNQIAFGADSKGTSNPWLFDMMDYALSKGIKPNITLADVSDDIAKKLAARCGAVAISRYANKDICYNSVKKLTDLGMTQINIHQMICVENFEQTKETLNDILKDPRLAKLNAIVFLSLKPKGRGEKFHKLSQEQFSELVKFALDNKINCGFDSCGCNKFIESVKDHKDFENFKTVCEPCESFGLFSSYVSVDSEYFPCSFTPGEGNWKQGINVENCEDFIKDIWNHPKLVEDRKKSINCVDKNGCRKCLLFDI